MDKKQTEMDQSKDNSLMWLAHVVLENGEKNALPAESNQNGLVSMVDIQEDETPHCARFNGDRVEKMDEDDTEFKPLELENTSPGACPSSCSIEIADDELSSFKSSQPVNYRRFLQTKRNDPDDLDQSHALSVSPCGVFLKFGTVIGRGAVKTVYHGLDSQQGVPIAWCEIIRSRWRKKDRQRFIDEAQMLSVLSHPNILRCLGYWEGINKSDPSVLITEYMTSGTLKSYIKRFKKVSLKIVKGWCVQILKGLQYLHSRTPPIIHRDLKCDNIFVQGASGCIKIGDLGLAIRAFNGSATSLVGTPEFMAAEMYNGLYDESVDIYAFGMCMIEILTSEYPYSECETPSQIYKNVTSGIGPDAYFRVEDPAACLIIRSCIQLKRQNRPNCMELLESEFFAENEENAGEDKPVEMDKKSRKRLIYSSDNFKNGCAAAINSPTPSSPPSNKSSRFEFSNNLNSSLMSGSIREFSFRKILDAAARTESASLNSGATAAKLPKQPNLPDHKIKRFTVRLVDESTTNSESDYRSCSQQFQPLDLSQHNH